MINDSYKKELKETRAGFGEALLELGRNNKRIVALCADLTGSLCMKKFSEKFTERFFQVGISEANMIGMAAGLAIGGCIPFTGSFANFSSSRVYDQIRQSIAYSEKNVKICASHAGITLGEDGATHQILEDLGMIKMLPGMTVINACDYNQTYKATLAISKTEIPTYLRFGRPSVPNFTKNHGFQIGKGILLTEGNDVSIIATGHLVWESLKAYKILVEEGIRCDIINIHTIKPIDEETILKSIEKTGCVVTAEEHNFLGGLGESIARILVKHLPKYQEFVAVNDSFGESGKQIELIKKYKIDKTSIVKKVKRVIKRKKVEQ